MKYLLLCCFIVTMAFSCKRSNDDVTPSAPPPAGEMVEALLRFNGEINLSESPLGKKAGTSVINARELRDSTIYYVIVRQDDQSIYSGIFNQPDSIRLKLPTTGNVTVQAAIYKRGSGGGLYYDWWNGLQDFSMSPIYGPRTAQGYLGLLKNKMDTLNGYVMLGVDTLYMTVFDPVDTTKWIRGLHSELDSYIGHVSFAGASAPAVVTVPMRRCVFGVQFSADNFNAGRLIAEFSHDFYSSAMATKYITPVDTATQFLYTADELREKDSLLNDAVTVKMQWENTDGIITSLGEKKVYFKRNVLTKIHVTIPPAGSAPFAPEISETTWSGSETVTF